MTRHDPRPTFEGRPLPRPEEEVFDQGLSFDMGTLLNRRRALLLAGVGLAGAGLAACSTTATASGSASAAAGASSSTSATTASGLTEINDETAGPYPGDGSNGPDVLEQSGVVRQDIRSSFGSASGTATGVNMTLELTILDIANGGAPMKDAAVYVWHCNADGNYSMYSEAIANENYLRGVQITDSSGVVKFTSIFPGCYSGRWPHIHFEVYPDQASITDSTKNICTSQVALPQSAADAVYALSTYPSSAKNLAQITLASDNVFGDDSGAHQIGTATGDATAGYTIKLTVPIDTSTAVTAGSSGGGSAPSAGGTPPGGGDGTPPGTPPGTP